jgi:hypothetical protein
LSDFDQIQKKIEEALQALKNSRDPATRRALRAELLLLLAEADSIVENSEPKNE